jgi:ionotropic glutamate receptor
VERFDRRHHRRGTLLHRAKTVVTCCFQKADLAIADLTVTAERESAVDFTLQFMNLGISILYKKPKPVPPSLFMFVSPFSYTVWLLLLGTYFVVSLCFFVMGRLSPSEWTNPFPCVEEPEYLINQFSIRNSLWFTIGSLMQQGTEIAPMCAVTLDFDSITGFCF